MPSLNLDIDYFNHPKTRRLIRLLGKGSEVLPIKLWVYTARYFTDDGRLTGISTQEIEEECCWWGSSGEMVRVMLMSDVRFLELDGDTLVVHEWKNYEGHLAAFKERARAGAEARWEKYRAAIASSSATSIPLSDAPTVPTVPTVPTNPTDSSAVNSAWNPALFEKFWSAWPRHFRKKGKTKCRQFWKQNKLDKIAPAVMQSLEFSKNSHDWTKESGKFIPMPRSWLGDTPWETSPDELTAGPESNEFGEFDGPGGFVRAPVTDDILDLLNVPKEARG